MERVRTRGQTVIRSPLQIPQNLPAHLSESSWAPTWCSTLSRSNTLRHSSLSSSSRSSCGPIGQGRCEICEHRKQFCCSAGCIQAAGCRAAMEVWSSLKHPAAGRGKGDAAGGDEAPVRYAMPGLRASCASKLYVVSGAPLRERKEERPHLRCGQLWRRRRHADRVREPRCKGPVEWRSSTEDERGPAQELWRRAHWSQKLGGTSGAPQ